jgi:hypothetical protein|nr:hypothetical protein [Kofleriaceae bacterium]
MRALLAIAALACVSACGGSGGGHAAPLSSSWQPPDELAYVPADTPYLVMALDNGADAVDDLAFGGAGSGIGSWLTEHPSSSSTPLEKLAYSTLQQLAGKSRAQIYQQLGLAQHGHVLIYGQGLAPVLRMPLADPKPLRDLIGQAVAAAGVGTPAPAVGPTAWTFTSDGLGFGIAVTDRELVGVISSADHVQQLLASSVHDRAANPIRADEIVALANRFGVTTAYFGEIDWQRAVAALEKQTAVTAPFKLVLPPDCRADAEWLAHMSPRMVFGYSRADAHGFDASLYFELAPEIAKGLDGLHVAMPAPHPASSSSLGTLETAVNLDAAASWLRGALTLASMRPMTCPAMSWMNDAVGKLTTELAQPLPPEIAGMRGMQIVVDDASISPPGGTGYALVSGTNLAGALHQLQQVPGLGGVAIGQGKPVQIPTAQMGMPNLVSYVGVGPDRAVVAVGADSEARVSSELAAPARERAPLFELTVDLDALKQKFPSIAESLGKSAGAIARMQTETLAIDVRASALVFDLRGTLR